MGRLGIDAGDCTLCFALRRGLHHRYRHGQRTNRARRAPLDLNSAVARLFGRALPADGRGACRASGGSLCVDHANHCAGAGCGCLLCGFLRVWRQRGCFGRDHHFASDLFGCGYGVHCNDCGPDKELFAGES